MDGIFGDELDVVSWLIRGINDQINNRSITVKTYLCACTRLNVTRSGVSKASSVLLKQQRVYKKSKSPKFLILNLPYIKSASNTIHVFNTRN